jgi:RimJ/RimL family protein N-acetyltransferase
MLMRNLVPKTSDLDLIRMPPDMLPRVVDDLRARGAQQLKLESGTFLVRPLRPEDARAYSDFISGIDEPDLRRRFAGRRGPLSDRDIARYTQIDYDRDMSFVAVRQSGEGNGEILGEVRAYPYRGGATAEVGIIVRSDMKRRGVGRALMETMIAYSKENGLELIGQIALDNEAMITLAERCGMQIERPAGTDIAVAHLAPAARHADVVPLSGDSFQTSLLRSSGRAPGLG